MQKGVANFQRRTWDKATYERLALEREDQERSGAISSAATKKQNDEENDVDDEGDAVDTTFAKMHYADVNAPKPSGSSKAFLDASKARANLDLDGRVGKVEKVMGGAREAGYRCELCDRVFQDSNALLDHLNSREHQARLGFSMQVAQSTKADVKSKLQGHLKKATTVAISKATTSKSLRPTDGLKSIGDRIRLAEESIEQAKIAKAQARKKHKKGNVEEVQEAEQDDEVEELDPGLKAMLGISGFGAN